MDAHRFAFITSVSDENLYTECLRHLEALEIPPGCTVEKIKVTGATSLVEAYNGAMRQSKAKYKIYVHQDVFILNRHLLADLLHLFTTYPRIGLMGVIGSTRLPKSGIWFQDGLHCYGKVWEYRRGGGLHHLLGWWNPRNARRKRLTRYWPVRGEYVSAVGVDGLILMTQYDVPWRTDLYGGFIYYEGPHCLEFIKRGHLVAIPRQEEPWCLHWGNEQERTPEQDRRYQAEFHRNMGIFRQEYASFLRLPARVLNARYANT